MFVRRTKKNGAQSETYSVTEEMQLNTHFLQQTLGFGERKWEEIARRDQNESAPNRYEPICWLSMRLKNNRMPIYIFALQWIDLIFVDRAENVPQIY